MLSRFFKLEDRGTTPMREFQAGLTTFAAMAYILAVNPDILAHTGMDKGALVTVTAITAALATALMALFTNYPIALAPGMGINAFFTFTICLGKGVPWSEALGMVFINGIIFLALSVSGVREKIITSIPLGLKIAVTCGVGLFIAFIGLKNGGVIVRNDATLIGPGDFTSGSVTLCMIGIVLTALLVARKVPGAIVIGILTITVAGLFVSNGHGSHLTDPSHGFVSRPHSPAPLVGKLTFGFLTNWAKFQMALPLIFTLLLVDMFDNIGTLIGVTKRAGLLGADGRLPNAGRALLADSIATILSSLCGTSTVVSYIESASGVEAGGRTGLTALTVSFLMLAALFVSPPHPGDPGMRDGARAGHRRDLHDAVRRRGRHERLRDGRARRPDDPGHPAHVQHRPGNRARPDLLGPSQRRTGPGPHRPSLGYAVAAMFFLSFFKIWPFS